MSGNEAFELLTGSGWTRGLSNMVRSGLARWFKTRTWWVHCLIWGGLVGGITSTLAFSQQRPPFSDLLMIFLVFIGLFPTVGVVIVMQDVLVGEKREGTAAWVLSKPVTRPAFMVSKVIANSIGILVTMVIVPAAIGYAILSIVHKSPLDPIGSLEGLGVIFVSHFFFISLTLMLGAMFNMRAPVIGIPLAILFLQQNLIQFLPSFRLLLPWNLVVPLGDIPSVVFNLMQSLPIQSDQVILLLVTILECTLFLAIGLWRFSREEF